MGGHIHIYLLPAYRLTQFRPRLDTGAFFRSYRDGWRVVRKGHWVCLAYALSFVWLFSLFLFVISFISDGSLFL